MDTRIRRNNADECHTGKIEAFGDHLRTEQNIGLASGKATEYAVMRALAARGIHIHSQNAHTGKLRFEGLFNALRPHTEKMKVAAVTRWTRRG